MQGGPVEATNHKSQITNPKSQTNLKAEKHQTLRPAGNFAQRLEAPPHAPGHKARRLELWRLGIWILFGIWGLGFGASMLNPRSSRRTFVSYRYRFGRK
jgi:hypothetical protein